MFYQWQSITMVKNNNRCDFCDSEDVKHHVTGLQMSLNSCDGCYVLFGAMVDNFIANFRMSKITADVTKNTAEQFQKLTHGVDQ